MDQVQDLEVDRFVLLMRICIEDPQESAEQLFELNQTEESSPEIMQFLAKVTRLKRSFHQRNQDCKTRESDNPSSNVFVLGLQLQENLLILRRWVMDLAKEMKQKKLTVNVIE